MLEVGGVETVVVGSGTGNSKKERMVTAPRDSSPASVIAESM